MLKTHKEEKWFYEKPLKFVAIGYCIWSSLLAVAIDAHKFSDVFWFGNDDHQTM